MKILNATLSRMVFSVEKFRNTEAINRDMSALVDTTRPILTPV